MSSQRFQVHASAKVQAELDSLIAAASSAERRGAMIAAARRIREILGTAPLDFGESRGDLVGLRLALRIGFVTPLVVHYGVSEEHHMVWIQSIHPSSRRG